MITSERVYERLQTVMDPETHLSVVEMGLIRSVAIEKKGDRIKIEVVYTLTTPGCPLAGTFPVLIWNSLRDLEPGFEPERDTTISLTFDPPWSIDSMSPEARAELNL
jgi:metal-sulfur cluster biosynthetic enzyme